MEPDENFKSMFDFDVPYVENPYPHMRRERLERDARLTDILRAILVAAVVAGFGVDLIRGLAA